MTEPSISQRRLQADIETVWTAISDPASLGEWLGGVLDIEVAEGAEGTIRFDRSEPEAATAVVLIESVEPPYRLVFRWASPVDAPTEVSIELTPQSDEFDEPVTVTDIRVVEQPIVSGTASRHAAQAMAMA